MQAANVLKVTEKEATEFLATSGVTRDDLFVVFKEVRATVYDQNSNEFLVQALMSAYQFEAPQLGEHGEMIASLFMTWYLERPIEQVQKEA